MTKTCIVCDHMRDVSPGDRSPPTQAVYEGYSGSYGGVVGACSAHAWHLDERYGIATLPERWEARYGSQQKEQT